MPQGEHAPSIDDLGTALAICDSTQALYARLEDLLGRIHALPAILYLRTGDMLHGVAGFDCSHDVPAVPLSSLPTNERSGELPANQVPLSVKGEVVGMLAVFGRVPTDGAALLRCCTILSVKLRHLMHEEALKRELHQSNEQVSHLVGAGQLLRHLEIDVLLVKILETVLGAVRVQAGAVLARDSEGREPDRIATWGLRERTVLGLRFKDGPGFVERVLRSGLPVCLGREEIRIGLACDGPMPQFGGLLALPLSGRGRIQGLVVLGSAHDFSPGQRRMAETLAGFASVALDNAMLVKAMVDNERLTQELSIARSVQEGMYPTEGLVLAGLRVEGTSRPCNETGGDYFTFIERGEQVLAMVGDVSGHGIGAALFATMAHAIVQQQLRAGTAIEPAFKVLNEGLCHAQSGRFMTAAAVSIDPLTRAFTYVSAGHCPLLWVNQGQVRWLDSSGMPLGIVAANEVTTSGVLTLGPGDVLLLYTDGFTECLGGGVGEAFGDERLAAAAVQGWSLGLGPTELMMLINSEVDAWAQGKPHEDDLTMVVIAIPR